MDYRTETVFSAEQYDGGFPPDGLLEFREWLNTQIAKIPAEFLPTASIEIDNQNYYDSTYATVKIEYRRPARPDEIAKYDAETKRLQELAEHRELAEFKRLAAKFAAKSR